jgi:acetyl esterase
MSRSSSALLLATSALISACATGNSSPADSAVAVARSSDSLTRADSAGARGNAALGALESAVKLGKEQLAVLDALSALNGKPIETLNPTQARQQPTPTDAVMALLKKEERPIAPETVANVVDRTIPGPGGALPVRVYTPEGSGSFPVIVYFHGGGFVIATNDTYDASARALANAAKAVVMSVEYRKAPEHKFPAAHDDALAAYRWVISNTASLRGDAARIALAGESAGGNLAVSTAVAATEAGLKAPVAILAVYPVAGSDTTTASYQQNAMAKPLNRAMMTWFFTHYTRTPADARDPRLNLLLADLKGLPPTTIVTAQVDPLRTDGELLAARLKAAGVSVELRNYENVAHEFFGQGAVVPSARDAVSFAAAELRKAFDR